MDATLDKPEVDVQTAIGKAGEFFRSSFATQNIRNLQLEEVEMSEDGKLWFITLGYDDPALAGLRISEVDRLVRPRPLRKYKVVHVDSKTGRALAIKNR